jgi:tRNA dimethylallyltransferase
MQMYNGLPIITNKVTIEEQKGIPHHLLGFIALDEEPWRVGLFKERAGKIIQEIRSRRRLPILVGGTHYYTQSLLFEDQLLEAGNVQTELPNEEILERFPILDSPTEIMLQRLKEVDPAMADQWHPNDRRKIRRSLEIFLLTGKRASEIYSKQKDHKKQSAGDPLEEFYSVSQVESTLFFWVYAEPETLKERLDLRVDKMMEAGMLDEIQSMGTFLQYKIEGGIDVDRTRGIWVSIGWKEFEQYLAALKTNTPQERLDGLLKLSLEQVQAATRQYANRQTRWIRIKFMNALAEHKSLERLFLMDGTDIKEWSSSVLDPAIKIVNIFLTGDQLPAPSDLSDTAKAVLAPKMPDEKVRQECDICSITTYTEGQWKAHLTSRSHRARIKNSLKKSGKWKHGVAQTAEISDSP